MIDSIEDAPLHTEGNILYEGAVRFLAEDDRYASQTCRFRADDEARAFETLDRLSDGCMYADPRIDYVRDFEVEEQAYILGKDGEPVGA